MNRSTGGTAKLNIAGGTLILDGNQTADVDGFISSGLLVAYNGDGTVIRDYDITNSDKTTVTANLTTLQAHNPTPNTGATDVYPAVVLGWVAGSGALTHHIYFGTDANAVSDANTLTAGIYKGSQPLEQTAFTPAAIALSNNYYWRVDEANDTAVTKGNIWQFTIADYALIDDFESYADSPAMLASWSSGVCKRCIISCRFGRSR